MNKKKSKCPRGLNLWLKGYKGEVAWVRPCLLLLFSCFDRPASPWLAVGRWGSPDSERGSGLLRVRAEHKGLAPVLLHRTVPISRQSLKFICREMQRSLVRIQFCFLHNQKSSRDCLYFCLFQGLDELEKELDSGHLSFLVWFGDCITSKQYNGCRIRGEANGEKKWPDGKKRQKEKEAVDTNHRRCALHALSIVWWWSHTGGALNSIRFVSHRFYWSEVPHARLSWGLCSGSRKAEGECWLGCVPWWSSGSPCKLIQLVTEFTEAPGHSSWKAPSGPSPRALLQRRQLTYPKPARDVPSCGSHKGVFQLLTWSRGGSPIPGTGLPPLREGLIEGRDYWSP